MPTYTFSIGTPSPFPWPAGKLLVARYRDGGSGATVTDKPLSELTPGEYSGTTQATSASSTFTVEIRQCATADSAGFDASTITAYGPDDYEPASSFTAGGTSGAPIGTTTFRLGVETNDINGNPQPYDEPGLVSVTCPAGIFVQGTSTLVSPPYDAENDTGTKFTRDGVGSWVGPTITDAASGLIYTYTLRKTFADEHTEDVPQVMEGSVADGATTLTSRAQIEATGKVNADVWADIDADANAASITAQFDRVVNEAQDAAREAADDAGALALWPLDPTDAQYAALVRAATDFAVARLQQMRPEPVAAGKEPVGVTGERVARERMLEVWESIRLRADTVAASAPVAETVTYYPPGCGYQRLTTYGPNCG